MRAPTSIPKRIAGLFALFGVAWIVVTDALVNHLVDFDDVPFFQLAKGLIFVSVSSGVVYALVRFSLASRESAELRFQTLFQHAPMGIAVVEPSTDLHVTNPQMQRFLGYTDEELRQLTFTDVTHPEDLEKHVQQHERLMAGDIDHYALEKRYVRSDGVSVWGSLGVTAVRGQAGNLDLIIGMVEDISVLKGVESELRVKTEGLETALNGYDVVDDNGRFIYVNQAYLDMWGYESKDEVIGTSPAEHCEDPDVSARIIETLDREGRGVFEFTAKRRDGSTFDVTLFACKTVDENGRARYHGSSLDLTERRRLEERLRESQKMEAIGRLAAGIAHDFNNLLQVIRTCGELAIEESTSSTNTRLLDQLLSAAARAERLIDQLLAFSRRQVIEPELVDLRELLDELMGMVERIIGEDIQLNFRSHLSAAPILGDRTKLEQVVLNLCVNARDSMPHGGTLSIELKAASPESETRRADQHVSLEVRDNGHGMDEATQERVFEPFFTTKPAGSGTGLGLATVFGIVHQHDGTVECASEPGRGTTFSVRLPLARGEAQHEPGEASTPTEGGSERILLAEDDEAVADVTMRVLRRAGYSVVHVRDGREALEIFRADPAAFDLAILDGIMPELSGHATRLEIRSLRPQMPVIIASGYNHEAIGSTELAHDRVKLLDKPYSKQALLSAIRTLVDDVD